MFFPDLLVSDDERRKFEKACTEFSAFFDDCNACLIHAFNAAHEAAAKSNEQYHVTILLLVRHVIESLDGVSILVFKGGSHPCQPLLRSALEAVLGILYILEGDTKRRALAYQVAHAHKRIKFHEKLDPTTDAGKDLRDLLKDDPCLEVFNKLPRVDYPKLIQNLKGMLAAPDFQPIEQEWQTLKKKRKNKEPEWFNLFGGP